MQTKLNLKALQIPLFWEDSVRNRSQIEKLFLDIKEADIVLLPEMFTTGFTMNATSVAETMEGPSIQWMQLWAKQMQCILGGSLAIKEGTSIFNRFVMVDAHGVLAHYDKRHTFTLAGEDKTYTSGTNSGLFEFKGWKICLRICYDLRFPVWSRNTQNYDLLIYVANWPAPRIKAWDILLQARAIENMSYVVGVNRIGTDEKDLNYSGHSGIYDALGTSLGTTQENKEEILNATVDYSELQELRKQLRFLEDRDNFDLY